jgi:hypothetical protein
MLVIFVWEKYKVFKFHNSACCGINHWLHMENNSHILELVNMIFKFLNNKITSACEPKISARDSVGKFFFSWWISNQYFRTTLLAT